MTDPKIPHWNPCDGSDPRGFRSALGAFATGVTVVAMRDPADGSSRAFTANSFSSVSLDPPLVSVCLGKNSASLAQFSEADVYSISILEASQKDVSGGFATRDPEAKLRATQSLAQDDAPYVPGSLATFVCTRHAVVDAGDHVILIGRVGKYRVAEGQPLGFFRGGYVNVGASLLEIEQLDATLRVGAIVGQGGKVMLVRRAGDKVWDLPAAPARRGQQADTVLQAALAPLGLQATLSVPYSLFQESDGFEDLTMYFAAESRTPIDSGTRADGTEVALFGAEDAPWDKVQGTMKQWLIRRYLRETEAGLFNLYFDTSEGGSLAPLGGGSRPWGAEDAAV